MENSIFNRVLETAQRRDPQFARPELVRPFKVDIPEEKVSKILERVRNATIPRPMPPAKTAKSAWETGMDTVWLETLRNYWLTNFNWVLAQSRLNAFPQFMAKIDGLDIHFYYVQGEGNNPRPLLLTHGWPGSVVEFLHLIAPLTRPTEHGGDADDAFSVIIPSLPGFGFSSMPEFPIQAITTARLLNTLVTDVIGHKAYFAQGGDIGAAVTVQLGYLFPENVKSIHFNLTPWFAIPHEEQTVDEKAWLAESESFMAQEFDYLRMQTNKPMMPAVALADSPLGTAAWIAEKFWAWTDNGGDLESIVSKETLLTNIMLYLVNNSGIEGSFWFYRAIRDEMSWNFFPGYVETPTAIATFPKDYPMGRPSLPTAKRGYNVVHYTAMPQGGHFAAIEQPELFVEDVRNAFRRRG